MSKIALYGLDGSPPVRACLLTLNALNLSFEFKTVDFLAGEQFRDEFTKHNPQHTVPVLNDNDIWLWDSHAICAYLVEKYDKSDELYPKDLAKRAVVNQRLHFDSGILFPALRNITYQLFRHNVTVVSKDKTDRIIEGYEFVEKFLTEHPYLAGDSLTIADFSCASTLSSLTGIVSLDANKFPKVLLWLERIAQLPFYEKANGKGVKDCIKLLRLMLTRVEL